MSEHRFGLHNLSKMMHRRAQSGDFLTIKCIPTEAYFERAFVVARQQQAKSWELRATMSMPRLRWPAAASVSS
jgi:hypothetical protein